MKKLILALFLCLSCLSFADWETFDNTDEFGDKIGKSMVNINEESYIIMGSLKEDINREGYYFSIHFINKNFYISRNNTIVKIKVKVDNSTPIEFTEDDILLLKTQVGFPVVDDLTLIDLLKKGKIMEVSMEKYDGTKILQKYDLNKFPEMFSKIK